MRKRNRPLPVAPRQQQQQRTSNLTRIVDVAIPVGIDRQQNTPQHFIGIFKSYGGQSAAPGIKVKPQTGGAHGGQFSSTPSSTH